MGSKHAILFSGTGDPWTLNDLEFCWRLLRDKYEVPAGNIQVLYFSKQRETNNPSRPATSFPSARANDPYRLGITGRGTTEEFSDACQALDGVDPQDTVFIYTNGHGSKNMAGKPYLLTFDNSGLDAQEFCDALALLPQHASLLIMMQQCYGAEFIDPIIGAHEDGLIRADRISLACASEGLSYANGKFSRFTWGWVAAHLDTDHEGKPLVVPVPKNNSGFIEAFEAYNYAEIIAAPPDKSKALNRPAAAKNIRLA